MKKEITEIESAEEFLGVMKQCFLNNISLEIGINDLNMISWLIEQVKCKS